MTDETESIRREMIASGEVRRDAATAEKRWTAEEMTAEFEVLGFMAPLVVVRRRADGVRGSLKFTHNPRVYFDFEEEG